MKKKTIIITDITIIWLMLLQVNLNAQTISGKPRQPQQLDRSKIRLLTKADLSIVNATLISAAEGTKYWVIKVQVTIKNSGETKSPATTVRASAKKDGNNESWKKITDVSFPALNPGQSLTRELVFNDYHWAVHKVPKFSLKLDADPENLIPEINESNNSSNGILIGL